MPQHKNTTEWSLYIIYSGPLVILLINILNSFIKTCYVYWMEKILGIINVFFQQKLPCPRWGSNSRPSDYETDALPTALRRLLSSCSVGFSLGTQLEGIFVKKFLSEVGFEPTPSSEDQKSPLIPYLGTRFKPWVWRLRPLGHPDMLELLAVCKS